MTIAAAVIAHSAEYFQMETSDQKDRPRSLDDAVIGVGHGCGRRITEHNVKLAEFRQEKAPEGYPFAYSLRHSDRDVGNPVSVERSVVVNFFGRIFSREEILKPEEDFLPVRYFQHDWVQPDAG